MEFKEWLEARTAEPVRVAKTINRLLTDLRIVKEKIKIMGGVASPIVANQLEEAAMALHKARMGVESVIFDGPRYTFDASWSFSCQASQRFSPSQK